MTVSPMARRLGNIDVLHLLRLAAADGSSPSDSLVSRAAQLQVTTQRPHLHGLLQRGRRRREEGGDSENG